MMKQLKLKKRLKMRLSSKLMMLKRKQKKKLKVKSRKLEMPLLMHYLVQKKTVIQILTQIQTLINQVNPLIVTKARNQMTAKLVQAQKIRRKRKKM